jgi:hypothetical protein
MLSFNVPFQSLLKPVKAHLPHTKRFPVLLVSEHGLYNRLVKIRLLWLHVKPLPASTWVTDMLLTAIQVYFNPLPSI